MDKGWKKKCDQEEFGPGAGDLGDHQHIQGAKMCDLLVATPTLDWPSNGKWLYCSVESSAPPRSLLFPRLVLLSFAEWRCTPAYFSFPTQQNNQQDR